MNGEKRLPKRSDGEPEGMTSRRSCEPRRTRNGGVKQRSVVFWRRERKRRDEQDG